MGKKKKKMTPAQAAAARRDTTPKREQLSVSVKDSGPVDRGNRLVVGVSVAMIILIAVLSFVFSMPSMSANG